MTQIYHKLTIEAPAKKVYEALTKIEDLQKWWMKDTRGKPNKVNGEIECGQKEYFYNKFKVLKLEENKKVAWEVLESFSGSPGFEVWNGTKVEFKLEEKQLERLKGKTVTILNFKHSGWPQDSDNTKIFAECNFYWAAFSLTNLKNICEGKPALVM